MDQKPQTATGAAEAHRRDHLRTSLVNAEEMALHAARRLRAAIESFDRDVPGSEPGVAEAVIATIGLYAQSASDYGFQAAHFAGKATGIAEERRVAAYEARRR